MAGWHVYTRWNGSHPVHSLRSFGQPAMQDAQGAASQTYSAADYTLTVAVNPVELAPNRIISTTTYNGQFPGPLLRFKEGRPTNPIRSLT